MSINIDKDNIMQENEVRILEIKELLPDLKRQIRALEIELKQLEQNNVFLSQLKSE